MQFARLSCFWTEKMPHLGAIALLSPKVEKLAEYHPFSSLVSGLTSPPPEEQLSSDLQAAETDPF
jgi:hypothetical protein